jgi:hypothetical protein
VPPLHWCFVVFCWHDHDCCNTLPPAPTISLSCQTLDGRIPRGPPRFDPQTEARWFLGTCLIRSAIGIQWWDRGSIVSVRARQLDMLSAVLDMCDSLTINGQHQWVDVHLWLADSNGQFLDWFAKCESALLIMYMVCCLVFMVNRWS